MEQSYLWFCTIFYPPTVPNGTKFISSSTILLPTYRSCAAENFVYPSINDSIQEILFLFLSHSSLFQIAFNFYFHPFIDFIEKQQTGSYQKRNGWIHAY